MITIRNKKLEVCAVLTVAEYMALTVEEHAAIIAARTGGAA